MCDSIIAHFIYLCLLIKNFDIVLDVHNLVNQRSFDLLFLRFIYACIFVLVFFIQISDCILISAVTKLTCKSVELYFKCTR
jgi:hypothetical protein